MTKGSHEERERFPSPSDVLTALQNVHDKSTLTWLQIAEKLGISEAYIHRVRKGEQKFSRKVIAKLLEFEASIPLTFGEIRDHVQESYGAAEREMIAKLQEEVLRLNNELVQARETIHNQAAAMAAMGRAARGPARPVSGAGYGNSQTERRAGA